MKNIYGIILAAVSLSSISIGAQAHTQEECSTEEYEVRYYWGQATCSDYDSDTGWVDLTEYYSFETSRYVWLSEWVSDYDYQENTYISAHLTCQARLPNTSTTTRERKECEPVEHEHETTTVAIADIQDDEMDIFDSNCSWRGWQNQTMVRQNKLSCNGEEVATVSLLVGTPYNGEECSDNILADGYSLESFGSGRCYIRINRND